MLSVRRSLYERALVLGRLLEAGWKRASCGCCWVPPWDFESPLGWDEDEALALTEGS